MSKDNKAIYTFRSSCCFIYANYAFKEMNNAFKSLRTAQRQTYSFFEFKNLQRYMYESRSLVSTLQPFADKNAEALLIYVLFLFQNRVPYYKN